MQRCVTAVDGKFPPIVGGSTGILISLDVLNHPDCKVQAPKPTDKPRQPPYDCIDEISSKYEVVFTEKTAANVTALTTLIKGIVGVAQFKQALNAADPGIPFAEPEFITTTNVYQLDKKMPHAPLWGFEGSRRLIHGCDQASNGQIAIVSFQAKVKRIWIARTALWTFADR